MAILVNGERIDDALVRQEAKLVRSYLEEAVTGDDALALDMRAWDWARENVIEKVLLRQAAMTDPELGAGVLPEQNDISQRVARLVAKLTVNVPAPKKKDVVDYYRKNRDSFYAPEMVHAGHIVKNVDERVDESSALEAIRDIERELLNGKSFEEVSDQCSDCPGNGGDLGFFPRGQMVQEFDDIVFSMRAGEISPIFRTPFGFHIAKVYERRAEGLRDLTEVRAEIEELLTRRSKEECVEQFVDGLRARANIIRA
jgi:parvulin-like peptidyl-prolyl isomerase